MKRICLFVCFAVMMVNIVSAQNLKKYEGSMKLTEDILSLGKLFYDGLESSAGAWDEYIGSYQYYENNDGSRIKHGLYKIKIKPYLFLGAHIEISGKYIDGKKDGKWTINHGRDNKIYENLIITFKDDELNGRFEYVDNFYYDNILTTETKIVGTIKDSIIQGDMLITERRLKKSTNWPETQKIQGTIGSDGLPQGIWTLTITGDVDMKQRRFYRNGIVVAIDEYDNSTGERNLIYTPLDNIKTIEVVNDIKDTIVYEKKAIVYNGNIAMPQKDGKPEYNSTMSSFSYGHGRFLIDSHLSEITLATKMQSEKWEYYYSQEEAIKYITEKENELKRKQELKERNRQDSIREAKSLYAAKLRESNNRLKEELIKYKRTEPVDKIKKSSIKGNEIVFQTKDKVLRGEFRKEYVKNDMGEPFDFDNLGSIRGYRNFDAEAITTVLSNKSGDIVLIRFKEYKNGYFDGFVVCLIDKRDSKADVYEVAKSALKGLPIEW